MTNVLLTCFADEISHDLEEQMDVLEQEGLKHLELRGLWNKNVLELTRQELETIQASVRKRGFAVSSIGSPIGKYPVKDDFAPQLEAMQRAIDAAHLLETPYIRIFSYQPPEDEGLDNCRDEVLYRMEKLTELAEKHKVILLLENDGGLYASTPEQCLEIFRHCSSPSLRMAFDPGNFIIGNVKPMTEAYPLLKNEVEYIHVKDAASNTFLPAGHGDGEIGELLKALKERDFTGFLSVEPHLHNHMPFSSNPKRVVTAIRALKEQLAQADMAWK
jgi:sugar phosphate isomerase/epimerase